MSSTNVSMLKRPPNKDQPEPHLLGKSKSNRVIVVEQDDGESNWLVSYADMMTLLFGFFVLLFSFSTPNAQKIEKMREETAKETGGTYVKPYNVLAKHLRGVMKEANLDKEVSVEQSNNGIEIISKGTLFFESGDTELQPGAKVLIGQLADVLRSETTNFRVVVEGHTDDNPINIPHTPSNWELSANRASTVVRLLESKGFSHQKLRPVGLSDTEPLVPNRDPQGVPIRDNQAQNRRIVIRIIGDDFTPAKDYRGSEQKSKP